MSNHLKNVTFKGFIASIILLGGMSINAAYAENVLSSIQINPDSGSYNVILKSSEAVPIKKIIESPDRMYLELQSIETSPSISTIYNNVPNIDNVVIKPFSKGNVKITLQGKNVSKSKIKFETTNPNGNLVQENKTSTPTVEINRPLKSYAPIFEEEKTSEETETSLNESIKNIPVLGSILAIIKKELNPQSMLYLIGFALMIGFGIKAMKNNNNSRQPLTIGLAKSLREQELEEINSSYETRIDDNHRYETTLRTPRKSSNAVSKTKTPMTNYGLKSYQNSQKSPYSSPINTTAPNKTFNYNPPTQPLRQPTIPQSNKELQSAVISALKTRQASAVDTAGKSSITDVITNQKPMGIDGMKFLESMTKIYEKNGRPDLATGLRNNLRKAQLTQENQQQI